ncbi:MAG: type I-A CRISPR-associated protein Cas7/Csa2 [Thermofilaceae archaeon]|uniref:Type I-A CRISPR-associated protein Cas7/Csa2 n=1 Tax=Thermofilum pendens TaxID=2269 RepID=A0A7C4H7S8_THEPE
MVYLSVRGRIWLQAEAMNMVESVGNYIKHRRVPVMVRTGNSYVTFFVPAVSGESVAHTYQVLLAEELKKLGVRVCKYCERGIFLKSTSGDVYKEVTGSDPPKLGSSAKGEEIMKAAKGIEEIIVRSCGVEDIGGFLYAENPNVKRTSHFSTGYVIPVKEVLEVVSMEPQLHSRYALGTRFVRTGEGAAGQMIYYVEVSSAVFSFAFDLDTKYIGRYTFHIDNYGRLIVDIQEIDRRVRASLEALKRLLIEFPVGAKRTRFNPADLRWESIAIAVSDDVWTMPSSFVGDYIQRAVAKKSKFSCNTTVHAYAEGGCSGVDKCYSTPEEAVVGSLEDALNRWAREVQSS